MSTSIRPREGWWRRQLKMIALVQEKLSGSTLTLTMLPVKSSISGHVLSRGNGWWKIRPRGGGRDQERKLPTIVWMHPWVSRCFCRFEGSKALREPQILGLMVTLFFWTTCAQISPSRRQKGSVRNICWHRKVFRTVRKFKSRTSPYKGEDIAVEICRDNHRKSATSRRMDMMWKIDFHVSKD